MSLARESGLRAISITDHDTLAGVKQILNNLPKSPEFIAGVEISCSPPRGFASKGSIHLLGYGFNVYDKNLNAILEKARISREQRNPAIIEKLNRLGIPITMAQVQERFGADQAGRPHIAELMREKGYVSSFKQAFDKYLAKNMPAYVDKFRISCEKAIHAILNAGGVPVLAHPGLIGFEDDSCDIGQFIDCLAGYGLCGIEVYYTDHDEDEIRYFSMLANRKNLIATGGSDFHGTFNAGVSIGTGKNNLHVSYSVFEALKLRLDHVRAIYTDLSILEENLGYSFRDRSLLETALCHSSYLNENRENCSENNERFEFLGDAVLGLCVGHLLMKKSPLKNEGDLSKLRSALVSEPGLAEVARMIDLGRFIRLGKGEKLSRGFDKNSILSDAFEAVVAAVYLDGEFDKAFGLISDLFDEKIDKILSKGSTIDYKSALQEFAQERGAGTPVYELVHATGPDHDKTFEITLDLFDMEFRGVGKTKKAAEQNAAENALRILEKNKV
jgi:ribonuclease III